MKTQSDRYTPPQTQRNDSVESTRNDSQRIREKTESVDSEYFDDLMEQPASQAGTSAEGDAATEGLAAAPFPNTAVGGKKQAQTSPRLASAGMARGSFPQGSQSLPLPETTGQQTQGGAQGEPTSQLGASLNIDSDVTYSGQEQAFEQGATSSLGDEILKVMNQKQLPAQPGNKTVDNTQLSRYIDQVAKQILVTEPSSSTNQQVRVLINDSILPQTEVLVSRDGAALFIQFVTKSEEASLLLTTNQQLIRDQLIENLSRPVSVDVSTDQQDGRSRGQRDIYSEQAEEE